MKRRSDKPAGYSGTPLASKLGIKQASRVLLLGAPGEYAKLVEPLPRDVVFASRPGHTVDITHVFVVQKDELVRQLRVLRRRLRPDAAIWVSWPKKSAGVATDVTEDTVRETALPLGFVDIKVCAVTDLWSGLKLVVRRDLR